jgi:CHAT domain-containing protein
MKTNTNLIRDDDATRQEAEMVKEQEAAAARVRALQEQVKASKMKKEEEKRRRKRLDWLLREPKLKLLRLGSVNCNASSKLLTMTIHLKTMMDQSKLLHKHPPPHKVVRSWKGRKCHHHRH